MPALTESQKEKGSVKPCSGIRGGLFQEAARFFDKR